MVTGLSKRMIANYSDLLLITGNWWLGTGVTGDRWLFMLNDDRDQPTSYKLVILVAVDLSPVTSDFWLSTRLNGRAIWMEKMLRQYIDDKRLGSRHIEWTLACWDQDCHKTEVKMILSVYHRNELGDDTFSRWNSGRMRQGNMRHHIEHSGFYTLQLKLN